MRKLFLFVYQTTVVLVFFLFVREGSAQEGCGVGLKRLQVLCTPPSTYITSTYCGGSGQEGYRCLQTEFSCDAPGETGNTYYTANTTYDDSCCSSGGCCANQTQCYQDGSGQVCDTCSCQCVPGSSPIIVDTIGKGFHLTSAWDGVMFDIHATGHPIQIAWTAADSGNAFLALDRNHNGRIDNGKELFGNITEQPKSDHPNGFLALAEFDKPENGGNGDGIIDERDEIFPHLLLWIDENHDGISQPNELHSLPELGVYSISLHYRDDRYAFDRYGNWFHYQAALNPDPKDGESKDGRVTYDVFFVVAHDGSAASTAQSHRPDIRLAQWELSIGENSTFGFARPGKVGCRSQSKQDISGGTR